MLIKYWVNKYSIGHMALFMITTSVSDMDSPVYGKEINQKLVWTESEMTLFENMNNSYGRWIVVDKQTQRRPFETYLKRKKIAPYSVITERDIDWHYTDNKLIIWRKTSLTRPVQVGGYRRPSILLGNDFKNHLDNNFHCIFDTGEARAYL